MSSTVEKVLMNCHSLSVLFWTDIFVANIFLVQSFENVGFCNEFLKLLKVLQVKRLQILTFRTFFLFKTVFLLHGLLWSRFWINTCYKSWFNYKTTQLYKLYAFLCFCKVIGKTEQIKLYINQTRTSSSISRHALMNI